MVISSVTRWFGGEVTRYWLAAWLWHAWKGNGKGGNQREKRGEKQLLSHFPFLPLPLLTPVKQLTLMVTRSETGEKPAVYLWARRGARNPNLQVFITHASHVCSQHSFGPPLWMNGMHIMQFDQTRLDLSTTRNLITPVLTICHIKLMQRTALEQKRFDLLTLSPTLHNLWLYY